MKKNKNSKWKTNLICILIFMFGLLIFFYPTISNYYYTVQNDTSVENFDKMKKNITNEDIEKRMKLARYFNESIDPKLMYDPYSETKFNEGRAEYARMLEVNEQIGYVKIPKILVNLPIYAGTSESVLQHAVGHMVGTSLPIGGDSTHTVLTAHTGLPNAKLFTDLDKLKEGDEFYIHNIKETLAYKVDQIKVVEPNDFSDVQIIPNKDYATLLTCTPYMVNTHRLLVRGHRIEYNEKVEEKSYQEHKTNATLKYVLLAVSLIILFILILILIKRISKHKKMRNIK